MCRLVTLGLCKQENTACARVIYNLNLFCRKRYCLTGSLCPFNLWIKFSLDPLFCTISESTQMRFIFFFSFVSAHIDF
jgi:hypothetical protein